MYNDDMFVLSQPLYKKQVLSFYWKKARLKQQKGFFIYQQYRHAIPRENFSYFTLERTSRSGFATNALAANIASKLDNL